MHATEMKTKRHYTTPVTQRAAVELEGGFCGSVMENRTVEAKGHEVGNDYTFDVSGTGGKINESNSSDGFSIKWD